MTKRYQLLCATAAFVIPVLATAGPAAAQSRSDERGERSERSERSERVRTDVAPYLEIEQVLVAGLDSGSDVLTYTTVAAGVDATLATRRAEGQISLRYERRFFYSDDLGDEDFVSGLARGNVKIIPNALQFEAGGLASRTSVDLRGPSPINQVGDFDNVTQVYSVYAGPTLSTNVGALEVNAAYRVGYTKIEADDAGLAPGQVPISTFDDSISQSASASIGMQPGELPVGWAVGAGWNREDASQLDQRFDSKYVRGDLTVPITPTLAVVGGIGYEDIEITERDALRDANGVPIIDEDGRFVTDSASPRLLSYDQDGIFFDAGVLWRPSRRTSLEARVGRRYDSTTYLGNFSYQPNRNSQIGLSVFDTVTGFGNQLNDGLAALGTNFAVRRNPLGGDLTGCAFGEGNAFCFDNALQSAVAAPFRARGVSASYSFESGPWNAGIAAGYQEREFLTSNLGALANLDGVSDESYFVGLSVGRQLDEKSSIQGNVFANYLESGLSPDGTFAIGGNAAYNRQIFRGLSGTAAVGIDYFEQQGFDSATTASALLGLRYDF